jgi:hypothetical protein
LAKVESVEDQQFFESYKKFISSVLFVNDALEDFFEDYKKRPEYKNTVFIITGDHPMTEVPIVNSLKRYHVPLIVYSEKLKNPQIFKHTVSHLDINETLLTFLEPYGINIPLESSALGSKLVMPFNKEDKRLAFMNDNRDVVDYYAHGIYLSEDNLYIVNEDLTIEKIEDKEKMKKFKNELGIFKKTSHYTSTHDKIISNSLYCSSLNIDSLYSYCSEAVTNSNSEYINIVNKAKVPNKKMTCQISFAHSDNMDETVSLVMELRNDKDSTLLWKNTGLTEIKNSFQGVFNLTKQEISDTNLLVNLYIWNSDKKEIEYSDLNVLLSSD